MNYSPRIVWVENLSDAVEACPWTTVAVQITGGWMCFDNLAEAMAWKDAPFDPPTQPDLFSS